MKTTLFRIFKDRWGAWIGIVLFIAILFLPTSEQFTPEKRNMLAIVGLMAVWWMTETLPLGVTALLPLILYPILGIMNTEKVAPNYMHHLVFLFMGGFIIAIALQKWQLHRRFALFVISYIGTNPKKIILAFMLVSAVLSMWISNTATAVMMLPIGLAVIFQLQDESSREENKIDNFSIVLMLGIAYACSIGGISTLIGTPPNIIFSGIYGKFFPNEIPISFIQWMIYVLPLTIVIFIVVWLYLVHYVLKNEKLPQTVSIHYFRDELKKLGKFNRSQIWVLIIFGFTALLWIFKANLTLGSFTLYGWPHFVGLDGKIQDSTIAIGMAILLFMIPSHERAKQPTLLDIKDLSKIPWDILLLFGGGFALAEGIRVTGLAEYIGKQMEFLQGLHPFVLIFVITISIIFITEFTSNTAVATTILPIIAVISIDLNIHAMMIMLPATIAASCAFMLPVATPPNASVYGSRYVPIQKMVKTGFWLNIISASLAAIYFYFLFSIIF
ncbi:MAG: SLC13 family permease [Calditrichia bacterium]